MNFLESSVRALRWQEGRLEVLDQTVLPHEQRYVLCQSFREAAECIRSMRVRGAPAIGITAAYGMALAAQENTSDSFLDKACRELLATRPTAVNLSWALSQAKELISKTPEGLRTKRLVELACQIEAADIEACRKMGEFGALAVPQEAQVLTHCNTGSLATGYYGTALGVVRSARDKISNVWVDETRPFLQGSRLTAWELVQEKIPCTLVSDNMAGFLMERGQVDMVIVGADRIAKNGDVANKIGTYSLAVLCRYHRIPFMVVAPISTWDLACLSGKDIPIETRDPGEVKGCQGRLIAPQEVQAYHPAFDVTPSSLITHYVSERGLAHSFKEAEDWFA